MLAKLLAYIVLTNMAYASFEYTVNVGTVLFSPADIQKLHWSKTETELLRARRYFQELLPPPDFFDTKSEQYIDTLLKFIRDTYSTIKREATNDEVDHIMTTAFSDAIGGYLNLWVLPVTKLAYYGGTVSQNNVIKLFQFHKELKKFLGTDGKGWRKPDKNVLHMITISTAPSRHVTREMKNACRQLAYYEKSDNGLSIPTPYINWEDELSTMFVPLRNHSLIPLNSTDYPNALPRYYDTAKNCLELDENDPEQYDQFNSKFQSWLTNDVVPHLSDDNVYLPLGCILTLVNKSHIPRAEHFLIKPLNQKLNIAGIPIDFSCKKTLIIIIILILEIAWCIPSLLYLTCRRKNKKVGKNQGSCAGMRSRKNCSTQGFKISQRPHTGLIECAPRKESTHSIETNTTVSVLHETKQTALKSSLKKLRSSHTTHSHHTGFSAKQSKSRSSCYYNKTCTCSKCSLVDSTNDNFFTDHEAPALQTRPVTFKKNSNSTPVKDTPSTLTQMRSLPDNRISKIKSKESKVECPCTGCIENNDSQITVVTHETTEVLSGRTFDVRRSYSVVDNNVVKDVGLTADASDPYLEIKIEKPQAEISVGIGGIFEPFKKRRSRIPKRLPKTEGQVSCGTSIRKKIRTEGKKTLIPQPRKQPVDDIDIGANKPKHRVKDKNRLNITL